MAEDKPKHKGGRPVKYHDPFHKEVRERMRRYRAEWKKRKEREKEEKKGGEKTN